jgi:choline-glycine betaine transporter
MRRAKAKLTVSTFPFLAVLLCAMGSLIMLLMVFDQRAKRAARQRNIQQAVEVTQREEERWK